MTAFFLTRLREHLERRRADRELAREEWLRAQVRADHKRVTR